MQTHWPSNFDPTPAAQMPFPPNGLGYGNGGIMLTNPRGDVIESPWWQQPGSNNQPGYGAQSGIANGIIGTIMSLLQQLTAMLGNMLGQQQLPGQLQPGSQHAVDATFSSTGDPHLAETGTTTGGAVDNHFDSMVSHNDLVDSNDIPGGYRVSTTVGAPNANGVTTNASATVTTNFGQDSVTMRKDGTFSITDHGQPVALAPGQSVTLSGGESVTENGDGSLVVAASNGRGGTISTTLRAAGGSEVDVTTQAHDINVGGDIARGVATPARRTAHEAVFT